MTKSKQLFGLSVACLIIAFSLQVNAQVRIISDKTIPKIKNGTTYVVVNDPDGKEAKEYMEVCSKYWKFNKIEFIKNYEVAKHIGPGSSFLMFVSVTTTTTTSSRTMTNESFYFTLWTCKDKCYKRILEDMDYKYMDFVAAVEMYVDPATELTPSALGGYGISGDGHVYNWSLGVYKNYIQQLTTLLNEGEKYSQTESWNDPELQKLQSNVLLVPDYVLSANADDAGAKGQKMDAKDLMAEYEFKYQVVSKEELDEKIMASGPPVYHLIFIHTSATKYINVYNSATGKMVYSNFAKSSTRIKPGDMKTLSKRVGKV